MRPTLFLIPHEFLGLPVFGIGGLLLALAAGIVIRLGWAVRTHGRWPDTPSPMEVIRTYAGIWLSAAVVIAVVLPRLELSGPTGDPIGIAVRGYGVFLMLAAVMSVAAAAYRAQRKGDQADPRGSGNANDSEVSASANVAQTRQGLSAEAILQLAPWTFISGILGARIFYVMQYYRDFLQPSWFETLSSMAAFTQGGLVVYGGLIGGGLVSAWFVWRRGWNVWQLGDVIVPCIFVGLFFGRLGCLMNGCCFGGTCEPGLLAAEFPPGSPVYRRQLLDGDLIGLQGDVITPTDPNQRANQNQLRITAIEPNSLASQTDIQIGDDLVLFLDADSADARADRPATEILPTLVVIREGRLIAQFAPDELPRVAQPVRATQVISATLAAVMFAMLLLVERALQAIGGRWNRPGVLLCLGCITYAILRIVLEWLRVDEAGQFGTALSISQYVSVFIVAASLIGLGIRLGASDTPPTAATQ